MDKTCPEHGCFSTLIWADSAENYIKWLQYGGISAPELPQTPEEAERRLAGLDFSCRACAQPSTSALMTTNRCNMDCPVCFTREKREPLYEPDLETCGRLMRAYREKAGEDAIIEFCGGEPTVRGDICDLASIARNIGFDFIQLNTNGTNLAKSEAFCRALKDSGITTVYMGFDGVTEKPYLAKYGKPMLKVKEAAVRNCAQAGLAVVLVTCVIPGENDGELGEIVEYAKRNMPAVKGVYLQPISYFGIYPKEKMCRITIPDVIRRLEEQNGDLRAEDFGPGAYEHAQCAFQACYMLDKQGRLRALTRMLPRQAEPGAVHRLRQSIRTTWMPGEKNLLTIGGMAFQDGWNVDLMRVRRCSIQIIQSDGTLVPLCSKYLSGCNGSRALPGIG
jgi:uncharacterized radical SAM superfamily Fe-S cluster-containing enzyme